MTHMYYILGTAGWIWFAVATACLIVLEVSRRRRLRRAALVSSQEPGGAAAGSSART